MPQHPVRVLLVEDQPALKATLTRALLLNRFAVDAVDNAADAQIRFRDQPPDLLLSDVTLPGAIDGFQLARWARDRHATLPIVLTSGLALSDPPPDLVADPYVRMLAKPFSVSALMAVLAEAQAAAAAPS